MAEYSGSLHTQYPNSGAGSGVECLSTTIALAALLVEHCPQVSHIYAYSGGVSVLAEAGP